MPFYYNDVIGFPSTGVLTGQNIVDCIMQPPKGVTNQVNQYNSIIYTANRQPSNSGNAEYALLTNRFNETQYYTA